MSEEDTMAKYDFRNQQVKQQYIADRDMYIGQAQNVGEISSREDLIAELDRLKAELPKAAHGQVIEQEKATDAEYYITKAVQEAQKPEPDKKTVLDRLNQAKQLVDDVTALGAVATGLGVVMEAAQHLFS